jgi:hypothetical protein
MSRKRNTLTILVITLALGSYMAYKALQGLSEAFENDDLWDTDQE